MLVSMILITLFIIFTKKAHENISLEKRLSTADPYFSIFARMLIQIAIGLNIPLIIPDPPLSPL